MEFEEFASDGLRAWLRVATGLSGDPHLARDLVQEVLIKVHARWDRLEHVESLDRYVHRMLTNEYLSWRRKWARVIPFAHIGGRSSAPDHAAVHADRDALDRQIAELPARQRIVIVLRYFADLPDLEIALIMGCSAGAVRSYASRALAALRVQPSADLLRAEGI